MQLVVALVNRLVRVAIAPSLSMRLYFPRWVQKTVRMNNADGTARSASARIGLLDEHVDLLCGEFDLLQARCIEWRISQHHRHDSAGAGQVKSVAQSFDAKRVGCRQSPGEAHVRS